MCPGLVDLEVSTPLCELQILKITHCSKLRKVELCTPSLSYFEYDGEEVPLIFKGSLLLEKAMISLSSRSLMHVVNLLCHGLPYLKTLELDLRNLQLKVFDLPEHQTQLVNLKHMNLIVPPKLIYSAASFVGAALSGGIQYSCRGCQICTTKQKA